MKKTKKDNKSQKCEKASSGGILVDGTVLEAHPNACFDVKLDNGHIVFCSISGKMRQRFIRVLPDDRVQIEISPYDLNRGRIKYRYSKKEQEQSNNDTGI